MDFSQAISAHAEWKYRLTDYIEGGSTEKLDPDCVCRDDQCPLGRWLHAPENEAARGLDEVRRSHAEFHRAAAEVIRCVHRKDLGGARRLLGGAYREHSTNVVLLLKALREALA